LALQLRLCRLLLALEQLLVLGPLLANLLGGELLQFLAQIATFQSVVRVSVLVGYALIEYVPDGMGMKRHNVPALRVIRDLVLELAALDGGFLGLLLGEVNGVASRHRQGQEQILASISKMVKQATG